MLNPNVRGIVWKTTPVREGQSPSPHRRPLPRFMTSSWQTDEYRSITLPESWVSRRTTSVKSSTTNFISPRCQHIVSQISFDLIWTDVKEKSCDSFRQIPTVFFRDLWLCMRPGSITSNQRQTTIERVETPRFSVSLGSQDLDVRRQGDVLHILGHKRSCWWIS